LQSSKKKKKKASAGNDVSDSKMLGNKNKEFNEDLEIGGNPMHQPVQLFDRENMVEFSDSEDEKNYKKQLREKKELDNLIDFMRHRKAEEIIQKAKKAERDRLLKEKLKYKNMSGQSQQSAVNQIKVVNVAKLPPQYGEILKPVISKEYTAINPATEAAKAKLKKKMKYALADVVDSAENENGRPNSAQSKFTALTGTKTVDTLNTAGGVS